MVLASIVALMIVLVIGISIITWQASLVTSGVTKYAAREEGLKEAEFVKRKMEEALTTAINLTQTMSTMTTHGMLDRKILGKFLLEQLEVNKHLNGTWAAFEPNGLDGKDAEFVNFDDLHDKTGGFFPYFFRTPDGDIKWRAIGAVGEDDDWYQVSYKTGKSFVTAPYTWEADGRTVMGVSFTAPIRNGEKTVGTAGGDILTDELSEELLKSKPFGTGSIYLLSSSGIWMAHPDPKFLGKNWSETHKGNENTKEITAALEAGREYTFEDFSKGLDTDVQRILVPVSIGDTGVTLSVLVNIPTSETSQAANKIMQIVILVGIVLLVVLASVLIIAGRSIIKRPLEQTIGTINKLIDGEYDLEVPNCDRSDEVGDISRALTVFRDAAKERQKLEQQQAESMQRRTKRAESMGKLTEDFSGTIGNLLSSLSNSVGGLNSASEELSAGAEETSSQSMAVAAASEQASANVETVAAAAEQLFASVNEIGRQVTQSTENAGNAVRQAADTNSKVEGLSLSADRIGEVVSLISDIAEQTNLLALNATIEAARAGDAGKGFAVVASEVKNLATQTARATEDITSQIQNIQKETKESVGAIKSISETIEEMNNISAAISAAVEEQGAATKEIARNVQEASTGTQDVSRNIQGVSQAADSTGKAATLVHQSAGDLSADAEKLQSDVDTFLSGVRAVQ